MLILALAGDATWQALGGAAPPPRMPAEPFYVALEPEPEPEPPPPAADAAQTPDAPTSDTATMPPMAEPKDVPQLATKPPQEPAPGSTLTMPTMPPSVLPRTRAGAAAKPAPAPPASPQPPNPQTAAVAPPPPPAAAPAPAPAAGVPAWQKFAAPFDSNDARPRIAVIIVDLGLSSAATEAAIQNLPGAVTLAFSPYADNLPGWVNLARAGGHESLLGLPMEPANFPTRDPGPRTLLTSLSPRENLDRLNWVLGRMNGYVGVINNQGSRFTASTDALQPVLTTLRDRGLMFVDAHTTPRSVAASLATSVGLPRAINDRQIDQQASRAAIDAMLADVEKVATETGNAVAMGQPYPVTFERLSVWLPTLEGKGFALAPITAMINRQPDS